MTLGLPCTYALGTEPLQDSERDNVDVLAIDVLWLEAALGHDQSESFRTQQFYIPGSIVLQRAGWPTAQVAIPPEQAGCRDRVRTPRATREQNPISGAGGRNLCSYGGCWRASADRRA